jgi:hypothetical protein
MTVDNRVSSGVVRGSQDPREEGGDVSAGAAEGSSRRSAIADATQAVRAAHPESDEQAATMLGEELHRHGVIDVADEAIAQVAPLSRRPRVVAGLEAAKMAVGTFWRLGHDLAGWPNPIG